MSSIEPDVMKYLVDDRKNKTISRRVLVQLKRICEGISEGPWEYDEDEHCQRIFSTSIRIYKDESGNEIEVPIHGLQLAKCPKKSKEYAEYWFPQHDIDFIIASSKWMLPLVNELLKHYPEEKE